MKKKLIELEVDFIGEQRPLTPEEEKILTDYFTAQKQAKVAKLAAGTKTSHEARGGNSRSAS